MKKIIIIPSVIVMLALSAQASVSFLVSNNDDALSSSRISPTVASSTAPTKNGFRSLSSLQIALPFGQDGLYVCSGPASASPSTSVYRANTMAGIFGVNVPTDRNVDPAAWYWIPTPDMAPLGWQWFDMLTTTNNSWKGATTLSNQLTSTQFGHRMVINTIGTYPVSAYTVTITSSLTNIASVTFGIATNSVDGSEIVFNPQFVGVDFGEDGVMQSAYSVPQGRMVASGDDKCFDAGQPPSSTNYTGFARFGATVYFTATTPASMDDFRAQFISSNHWFKVELRKNGVLISSKYVESALAKAMISQNSDSSALTIEAVGGQENSPYSIQSRKDLETDPWQSFMPGVTLNSGTARTFPNPGEQMRFFRLLAQ